MTLAVLSILVFVHEAGHFFMAKRAGIRVLEFGFGLPPRAFGKKIGETVYSINLLPIGGFVRLFGEEEEEFRQAARKAKEKHWSIEKLKRRAFFSQPKRTRFAIVFAGVVMNFILGVTLFSALYTLIGIPTLSDKVQILGIAPASPAAEAFKVGDEVISVGGTPVDSPDTFKSLVEEMQGEEVAFEVVRGEEKMTVDAVPRSQPPEGEGALGVVISRKLELVRYPVWQMPFRGAWVGLNDALGWGLSILQGIAKVFADLTSGVVPKDVGGPLEIHFLISEVAQAGVAPLVQLVAVLSVNLAVVNLLPIPALDGGRLALIGVELVTRRRINAKVERVTHAVGMAFVLALIVAITLQDILRRFGEDIGAFVERMTQM